MVFVFYIGHFKREETQRLFQPRWKDVSYQAAGEGGYFWGPKPQKTTSFQTEINSRPVAEQSRDFGSATRVWYCCFPCFPCFLQVLHSKPTSSFRLLPNPASKDVGRLRIFKSPNLSFVFMENLSHQNGSTAVKWFAFKNPPLSYRKGG